jgi:hypothetical protein
MKVIVVGIVAALVAGVVGMFSVTALTVLVIAVGSVITGSVLALAVALALRLAREFRPGKILPEVRYETTAVEYRTQAVPQHVHYHLHGADPDTIRRALAPIALNDAESHG